MNMWIRSDTNGESYYVVGVNLLWGDNYNGSFVFIIYWAFLLAMYVILSLSFVMGYYDMLKGDYLL